MEIKSKNSLKEERQDNRPITEKVKTFKDALEALGNDHPLVKRWRDFKAMTDSAEETSNSAEETSNNTDLITFYKLRIITAALNEGWEPQFAEDEYLYFPWFDLYTQEEWDKLDEDKKKGGVLFSGDANDGAYSGFVYAYSYYTPSAADADIGSHLCFKTDALALYAGRQFAALYADYLLVRK